MGTERFFLITSQCHICQCLCGLY